MEEKLKSLENNLFNKENTKSLLNIIQTNMFEQQQKTIQMINEKNQNREKVWLVNKTPQNKLNKFKKVKEKFYGK